jgi:hypothetical protein
MKCRHCASALEHSFIDLGFAPPSNAYLNADDLSKPEKYFPLKVSVCHRCWLAQTDDYTQADELFNAEYAYFSSTSLGWLRHAAEYSRKMIERLKLDRNSFVIEVASNDGYLLRNFVAAGVPCLGIEPTRSTALAAERLGIEVLQEFFGEQLGRRLAQQRRQADLIAGNNVFAHVPDINDFTLGLKAALRPGGTITLEFPHLMRLIEQNQFDTIYHEHFSYLSLYSVERIFAEAALRVWDVEELSTHGGSLRIYGCHNDDQRSTSDTVHAIRRAESERGLQTLAAYCQLQQRAEKVKIDLLDFLIEQKRVGKKVAAYGAAAKGNTLLNYAGVKPDLLPLVCDAAAAKQGKFMPGSHIPILAPAALSDYRPDFVLILPWNIAGEIVPMARERLGLSRAQFVVCIPELRVVG